MADRYRWAGRYQKEGVTIFGDVNAKVLKAIQLKYQGSFHPFFVALSKQYKSDILRPTKEQKQVTDMASLTQGVGITLARLLGERMPPLSEEDLSALWNNMQEIEVAYNYFQSRSAENKSFEKKVKAVQLETGISLEQGAHAHQLAKGRLEKGIPSGQGFGTKLREMAPGLTGVASSIGQSLLTSALGPFAGMGRLAIGTVTGIAKHVREKASNKDRMKFATNFATDNSPEGIRSLYDLQMGTSEKLRKGYRPEGFGDRYSRTPSAAERATRATRGAAASAPLRERAGGIPTGEASDVGRYANEYRTYPEPMAARPTLRERLGLGIPKTAAPATLGLFTFFNKDAYTARWTHDVLELLTKISKKTGVVGGGAVAGLLGAGAQGLLGKIAPFILPSLSILAGLTMGAFDAAKGVQKAGEWFGRPEGEKVPLGQKVAAATGGFLGGAEPGIGEKGSTWGGVGKQTLWGAGKGALIGGGIGSFIPVIGTAIGAAIGAAIGGLGGLIGGKRIAVAAQALWRATPLGAVQEAVQGFKEGGVKGAVQNLGSAATFGLIKKYDAKAIATSNIEGRVPLDKIPVTDSMKNLVDIGKQSMAETKQGFANMSAQFAKMGEGAIAAGGVTKTDIYNIRNPLVEGLSAGNLDLEI